MGRNRKSTDVLPTQCVLNGIRCLVRDRTCVALLFVYNVFFCENCICRYVYIYNPEPANNSAGLICYLWWDALSGFIQNLAIQSSCTTLSICSKLFREIWALVIFKISNIVGRSSLFRTQLTHELTSPNCQRVTLKSILIRKHRTLKINARNCLGHFEATTI